MSLPMFGVGYLLVNGVWIHHEELRWRRCKKCLVSVVDSIDVLCRGVTHFIQKDEGGENVFVWHFNGRAKVIHVQAWEDWLRLFWIKCGRVLSIIIGHCWGAECFWWTLSNERLGILITLQREVLDQNEHLFTKVKSEFLSLDHHSLWLVTWWTTCFWSIHIIGVV